MNAKRISLLTRSLDMSFIAIILASWLGAWNPPRWLLLATLAWSSILAVVYWVLFCLAGNDDGT